MLKKIKNIGLILLVFGLMVCLMPINFTIEKASAETIPPEIIHGDLPWPDSTATSLDEEYFLHTMLPNLIKWFLGFLASAAMVVIMIGGYMFLTSFGGEQTDRAKKTITYAIIGLLAVILSYSIVSIIQNIDFFGQW